jgi:2-polyprenyl-6-methoxyphenol hydroxylase-like FAD-dependent oxidoreductase
VENRTAEVAGAGLVGLATAAALAKNGWKVRVHERSGELREIGAGIILWGNALRALNYIGALDEVIASAQRVQNAELRGEGHRVLRKQWLQNSAMYSVVRRDLHQALANAALRNGAEILTGSFVSGATADGKLLFADGTSVGADLIIGTDGVHSRVRDSLNLVRSIRNLEDGCGRHLIARNDDDGVGRNIEEWHGGRRIGLVPAGPDSTYVFLCCPARDTAGRRQQPFDRATWLSDFPDFQSQLDRIPSEPEGRWAPFYDVECSNWAAGNVAILGDAAHAMSPNLGMSVCVAFTNAVALAETLAQSDDVPAGLKNWEASEKWVADKVQSYSRRYGMVGTRWPRRFTRIRDVIVKGIGKSAALQAKINFASEYHPPIVRSGFDIPASVL